VTPGYVTEELRTLLETFDVDFLFRIIKHDRRGTPLAAVPAPSRFSDPTLQYSVLYGATTIDCALWEGLIRDRFDLQPLRELPRVEIECRHLVLFNSTRPLSLLDIRGGRARRIFAPTAVTGAARQADGQTLSHAVYTQVPEADGLIYDSRFTSDGCIAIFDRAFGVLHSQAVQPLTRIPEVHQVLRTAGITLVRP
jgi:hypothetical protein